MSRSVDCGLRSDVRTGPVRTPSLPAARADDRDLIRGHDAPFVADKGARGPRCSWVPCAPGPAAPPPAPHPPSRRAPCVLSHSESKPPLLTAAADIRSWRERAGQWQAEQATCTTRYIGSRLVLPVQVSAVRGRVLPARFARQAAPFPLWERRGVGGESGRTALADQMMHR